MEGRERVGLACLPEHGDEHGDAEYRAELAGGGADCGAGTELLRRKGLRPGGAERGEGAADGQADEHRPG